MPLLPAYTKITLPLPHSDVPTVPLVTVGFGDTGESLREMANSHAKALVIQGLGAGHVPEQVVQAVSELASQMPVVLATRVANGPVFERTYGFAGSEIDLIARGLIPSKGLGAVKSRLLMQLALASAKNHAAIRSLFNDL